MFRPMKYEVVRMDREEGVAEVIARFESYGEASRYKDVREVDDDRMYFIREVGNDL